MKPVAGALLSALVGSLAFIPPAARGDFVDGLKAYEQGEYDLARLEWQRLADDGNPHAQFGLGSLYEQGEGVEQNFSEAAKWYLRAAEQGHALAQFNLAELYLHGRGMPQDYGEAVKWNRLAADQGLAVAQFNLGGLYYSGEAVERDYVKAYMWLTLAAQRGLASASSWQGIVSDLLTAEQLQDAQRRVQAWIASHE